MLLARPSRPTHSQDRALPVEEVTGHHRRIRAENSFMRDKSLLGEQPHVHSPWSLHSGFGALDQ